MRTTQRRRRAGDIRNWRSRRIAGLLAVVLWLTLAPAAPARANGEVNWDAQQARDQLFSAYMRIHAPGTQGLRDLVLSVDAMDWRRSHPNAGADDISRRMALVGAELDKRATADVYGAGAYATLMTLIDAASGIPGVSIATPALQALLESTVGEQLAQTAAIENQVTGAYQTNMFMTAFFTEQDRFWGEVTRFGRNDDSYTAAWNGMIGGRASIHLGATIEQLQADPLLGTYVDVEALLLHQNKFDDYLAEIRRQVREGVAALNAQNEQIREQLLAMSLKYPVGPGPKPTPQDYTRAMSAAAERQVVLDAAGSALFVLSTLAGFADKNLGKHISTIGKAGLAIATSINQYLPTVAGLGLPQALGSMSTMVLTGNILGAVMSVVPMFASGPTPEQMIMDQLRALREDVEKLSKEMHSRFDAIERSLAVVYGDMMTQFGRLFQEIDIVRGQLTDIQARLFALDTKLDSFALFTARALQNTTLIPMRTAINGYLNYAERTGGPMTYEKYTDDAENVIHFGTTGLSRLEPMASTSASFGDDPITILNRYGPGGSLSYLIWLANARYGAKLPEPANTAPSSGVFQLGGRAYASLQLQNPEHARRVASSRADGVRKVGTDHLAAARVLSSNPGNPGTPNRIFTQLLSEYREDVGLLNTELTAVRNRLTDGKYNPFGPTDATPTSRVTGPASLPICSGYGVSQATPANLFRDMPNVFHNATIVLPDDRKPVFSGCWSAQWTDIQGDPTETWAANLEITVRARVQWPNQPAQEFRTVQAKKWYGNVCVYNRKTQTQTCDYADTVAQQSWGTYRALLEQSGVSSNSADRVNEASTHVKAGFNGKIRQYYDTVNKELNTATVLEQRNRRLMETIALLRAYTEVAFPKALAGNPLLSSLLFGVQRIPGDYSALPGAAAPDRKSMSDAYIQAAANYVGCTQKNAGAPCQLDFEPKVRDNQAAPYDTECAAGAGSAGAGSAGAGSAGDHVSNCLNALAGPRADQLGAQYTRHFKEVHDQVYVEGSPEVEALVAELQTVDRVVRA